MANNRLTNPYKQYFLNYDNVAHRQYDALRAFFHDGMSAEKVAKKFGYTLTSVYTTIKRFKKNIDKNSEQDLFFVGTKKGRRIKDNTGEIAENIIKLRKQYL